MQPPDDGVLRDRRPAVRRFGKTCVIVRLTRDAFDTDYVPAIQGLFERLFCLTTFGIGLW
jgi:hypothetical protein